MCKGKPFRNVMKWTAKLLLIVFMFSQVFVGTGYSMDLRNVYDLNGLQVYEGFNYTYTVDKNDKPNNYLHGDGGATNGWGGSWINVQTYPDVTPASEKAAVVESSIPYTNVATSGHKAKFRNFFDRSFAAPISGSVKPVWISMMHGFASDNPGSNTNIAFSDETKDLIKISQTGWKVVATPTPNPNPEITPVPTPVPNLAAYTLKNSSGTSVSTGKGFVQKSPVMYNFLIIKIVRNQASLWVNPTMSTFNENIPPDAIVTNNEDIRITKIHFTGAGYDTFIDELRIGYDIPSVTTKTAVDFSYTPIFTTPAFSNLSGGITDITETGQVTATVNVNYSSDRPLKSAALILALYHADGTLINTEVNQVDDIRTILTEHAGVISKSIDVTDETQYIKAFLWDGLNSMIPITSNKIGIAQTP